MGFFSQFAAFSLVILGVTFVQKDFGLSAFLAGLVFLPRLVPELLFARRAGHIADVVGPTLPIGVGMAVIAAAMAAVSVLADRGYLVLVVAFAAVGLGVAMVDAPRRVAAQSSVARQYQGVVAGISSTTTRLGATFGIAVLGGVIVAIQYGRSVHLLAQTGVHVNQGDRFALDSLLANGNTGAHRLRQLPPQVAGPIRARRARRLRLCLQQQHARRGGSGSRGRAGLGDPPQLSGRARGGAGRDGGMTLARLTAAICALALSAGVASCTGTSGTPTDVANLEARFSQCELRQSAPRCYAPQQIRRSYEVQGLLDSGVPGRGERVVIVENASPSLRHDVHIYDRVVGLDDPQLTVVQPFGATRSDEDSEDVLDVETVHSIAPGAGIIVVDAHTAKLSAAAQAANMIDGASLLRASQYVIEHDLGDVLSLSWSTGETCLSPRQLADAHRAFQQARDRGMTVVASAGDQGDIGRNCASATTRGVNYPATDPLVMSVGGTRLAAVGSVGTWQGETTWNESTPQLGANRATGGGYSSRFARPDYQPDAPGRPPGRAIPDVAYDADHQTGVPTARSVAGTTKEVSGGGTSLGAPSWAGIVALADQRAGHRVGFINAALYRIAAGPAYRPALHDITQGDNTLRLDVGSTDLVVAGYDAGPGWDPVTGLGSPRAPNLAATLPVSLRPTDGTGL